MNLKTLKPFLDSIIVQVEVPAYIHSDPVQFMHAYDEKEDREIAGFLAAIMAWGHRTIVNNKVAELLERMNHQPAKFVADFSDSSFSALKGFKHRTFKDEDFYWLMLILRRIYQHYADFESFWVYIKSKSQAEHFVQDFHRAFFDLAPDTPARSRKHIANGEKKSTCKRLLLFLRWAVRQNSCVDLGIYQKLHPHDLVIPFDVHVARVARNLGLITRSQDDWQAVMELHKVLKTLDPNDPAKYDYALFGIGILKLALPNSDDQLSQ
jgi:uncharacterized protein (TIGR02757 family)